MLTSYHYFASKEEAEEFMREMAELFPAAIIHIKPSSLLGILRRKGYVVIISLPPGWRESSGDDHDSMR